MKFLKMITAFWVICSCFLSAVEAGGNQVEKNIQYQNERMEILKNDFYADYVPCDESEFAAFDIEEAMKNGVKYNELQFVATHNSYQIAATEEYKKLYHAFSDLTLGIMDREMAEFTMDSLTEQFELGIRSVELDIETVDENGEISFIVTHNPLYDNTTSCYDFEKALEEIALWSEHNPSHLPLTIIIEPKKSVPPVNNMKNFTAEYANVIDGLLREKFADKLMTPADMMGTYSSLKEMRENDGWPTLEKTMGRVIVLLHDSGATSGYIKQDKSMKTQAMFPMLRYRDRNKEYASFIIDNVPETTLSHKKELIDRCNLMVRTRADSFPVFSDERYDKAIDSSAQIVSTDFPFRLNESRYHEFSFDGYTVKLQK